MKNNFNFEESIKLVKPEISISDCALSLRTESFYNL